MPFTVGELRPREGRWLVQVILVTTSSVSAERDLGRVTPCSVLSFYFSSSYWVVPEVRFRSKIKLYPFFWVAAFSHTTPNRWMQLSWAVTSFPGQARPFSRLWQYRDSLKGPWSDRGKDIYRGNRSALLTCELAKGPYWVRLGHYLLHFSGQPPLNIPWKHLHDCQLILFLSWVSRPCQNLLDMHRTLVDKAQWNGHLHLRRPWLLVGSEQWTLPFLKNKNGWVLQHIYWIRNLERVTQRWISWR